MSGTILFTDVSVKPRLRLGVGGYLFLPASFLTRTPREVERSEISGRLVLKRCTDTSSTGLEIQTVIWALEAYRQGLGGEAGALSVYTDSQCVAGLPARRPGLEAKGFLSGKTHRPLKHASLYRRFYQLSDELGFQVEKVAGHTRQASRGTVDQIFSFVDREVRKAMGGWMQELPSVERDPGADHFPKE